MPHDPSEPPRPFDPANPAVQAALVAQPSMARRTFLRNVTAGTLVLALGGGTYVCASAEEEDRARKAQRPDGRPRLKRSYSARLRYDRDGLASVMLFNGTDTRKYQWFYVRRGVIPVPVESMDNGPDYFEDGLARARVGGKIGYIDRKLNLVIPAT